jgi:hypothetical protein
VLERETGLADQIEAGTTLDAEVTKDLLVSLFQPHSPLHDGAVVIQNGRIAQAGCILPLTQRPELPEGLGTRHRAALGITEETDAVAVVVSEETGVISLVLGGELLRNSIRRLRGAPRACWRAIGASSRRSPTRSRSRARSGWRSPASARRERGARDSAMPRRRSRNFRMGLLALVISTILWGIAHGSSSVERGLDIPISFHDLPDDLVITGQSTDQVNIRVRGSRAALRNLSPAKLDYVVDVARAKPGLAYEVDVSRFDLPRGANVVSRSPATLEVDLERRGRRSVRIRPDIEGEPAPGFLLGEVQIDPPRVWLTGARSEVMRLSEVVTETIEVAGQSQAVEREVRLSLGGGHVWMEQSQPVRVTIPIEPVEGGAVEADQRGGGKRG